MTIKSRIYSKGFTIKTFCKCIGPCGERFF